MKKRPLAILISIIAIIVCFFSLMASVVGSGSSAIVFILPVLLLIALAIFVLSSSSLVITTVKDHINAVKNGERKKLKPLFKVLCLFGGLIDFLIIGILIDWDIRATEVIWYLILLIIPGILTQCLYFTPYLIANKKGHPQENAIFVLNLFAGWTIIAWIIALVWACTEAGQITIPFKANFSKVDELTEYKRLLDGGVISQEEFDAKKKQILDL